MLISTPLSLLQQILTSTLEAYGSPNGHSAMALTVGVPCGIVTQLVLDGVLNTPGVHAPYSKEICDPIRAILEREGLGLIEKALWIGLLFSMYSIKISSSAHTYCSRRQSCSDLNIYILWAHDPALQMVSQHQHLNHKQKQKLSCSNTYLIQMNYRQFFRRRHTCNISFEIWSKVFQQDVWVKMLVNLGWRFGLCSRLGSYRWLWIRQPSKSALSVSHLFIYVRVIQIKGDR